MPKEVIQLFALCLFVLDGKRPSVGGCVNDEFGRTMRAHTYTVPEEERFFYKKNWLHISARTCRVHQLLIRPIVGRFFLCMSVVLFLFV